MRLTDEDHGLSKSLHSNLKSAALCGLLLIPREQCSEEELYCNITSISYQGLIYVGDYRNYVLQAIFLLNGYIAKLFTLMPTLIFLKSTIDTLEKYSTLQKGSVITETTSSTQTLLTCLVYRKIIVPIGAHDVFPIPLPMITGSILFTL